MTDVQRYIPHRAPMLLVDRVSHVDETSITAHHRITGTEPWYPSPESPCPLGLLLESWAQAAVLLGRQRSPNPDVRTGEVDLLTMFRRVTLLWPVFPGDELAHRVVLEKVANGATVVSGSTSVGGEAVLEVGMCVLAGRPVDELA